MTVVEPTPDDLLDTLMKDYKNPEDLIGDTGLLKQLTKQLLERAMKAEMTEHLGYEKKLNKILLIQTIIKIRFQAINHDLKTLHLLG